MSRKGNEGTDALDALLLAAVLEVVPFDDEQAAVARLAYARFGKRRHPANLNFGDCAVYALAATRALPLLFKERTSPRPISPAARSAADPPHAAGAPANSTPFSFSSCCSSPEAYISRTMSQPPMKSPLM